MGEPLAPEDLELLKRHLQRFPQHQQCPVCFTRSWAIGGVEIANSFSTATNGTTVGGPAVPMIVLACSTCGYIRQFSWMVIKRSAGGNLGG